MNAIVNTSVVAVIATLVVAFLWVRGWSSHTPPEPPARPSLQTTGELVYELRGEGEPVLLIHGALIEDTFLPLLGEPALSDYRLILYHRRGYGRSARLTGPFSIADQAADARALLEHLGVDRAHVVGLSSGGIIAMQLALDAPQRVHSLVLLEPALGSHFMSGLSLRDRSYFMLGRVRAALGNPASGADAFLRFAAGPDWREHIAATVPGGPEQAERASRGFFQVEMPAGRAFEWDGERAARISQPVLWINGGQSVLSPDIARQLVTWFPEAEFVVIPDATHSLPMHKPRAVAEAIARFLPKQRL